MSLDEVLDRVPLAKLEAAIRRRRRTEKVFPYLLQVSAATGVDTDTILGQSRAARDVRARHELYRRLWRAGFTVSDIVDLTGHERSRISYALRPMSDR